MDLLVEKLSLLLNQHKMMLVTAESCTGGLIAASITDRAGSSSVFDRGFVTYTNQSKIELLGVAPDTLNHYGAVSEETAQEMALGALSKSNAHIAVSVTGIAGPSGGSAEKPVGLVYIGVALKNSSCTVTKNIFDGNRSDIRRASLEKSLTLLIEQLGKTA